MATTDNRMYRIYRWILTRCYNKNNKDYKNYWWRWITCEWKSFKDFEKDMLKWYSDLLEIDRKENDWNYCKNNCRWVTDHYQSRNKRSNLIYKWKCVTDWCKELDITRNTVYKRIQRWFTLEKALWF